MAHFEIFRVRGVYDGQVHPTIFTFRSYRLVWDILVQFAYLDSSISPFLPYSIRVFLLFLIKFFLFNQNLASE